MNAITSYDSQPCIYPPTKPTNPQIISYLTSMLRFFTNTWWAFPVMSWRRTYAAATVNFFPSLFSPLFTTNISGDNLRSILLPLLPKRLNRLQQHLPAIHRVKRHSPQAHVRLLPAVRTQKLLQQDVLHLHAHKHAAVGSVLLLRAVFQIHEP